MALIGELMIEPDTAARVVIDARTGTVVIGQDVQISTVAVTHGTLNVKICETPQVSQPAPFSQGKTKVTPRTQIDVEQAGGQVAVITAPAFARWWRGSIASASSRAVSSRSSRRSSPPAHCKPI